MPIPNSAAPPETPVSAAINEFVSISERNVIDYGLRAGSPLDDVKFKQLEPGKPSSTPIALPDAPALNRTVKVMATANDLLDEAFIALAEIYRELTGRAYPVSIHAADEFVVYGLGWALAHQATGVVDAAHAIVDAARAIKAHLVTDI